MKNILFISTSQDGASMCHIDDLNKLDTSISIQRHIKDCIEFYIKNSPEFGSPMSDYPNGTFGEYFEVIYGEILDSAGYLMLNTLHSIYGQPKLPYKVEHTIFCKSNI